MLNTAIATDRYHSGTLLAWYTNTHGVEKYATLMKTKTNSMLPNEQGSLNFLSGKMKSCTGSTGGHHPQGKTSGRRVNTPHRCMNYAPCMPIFYALFRRDVSK